MKGAIRREDLDGDGNSSSSSQGASLEKCMMDDEYKDESEQLTTTLLNEVRVLRDQVR